MKKIILLCMFSIFYTSCLTSSLDNPWLLTKEDASTKSLGGGVLPKPNFYPPMPKTTTSPWILDTIIETNVSIETLATVPLQIPVLAQPAQEPILDVEKKSILPVIVPPKETTAKKASYQESVKFDFYRSKADSYSAIDEFFTLFAGHTVYMYTDKVGTSIDELTFARTDFILPQKGFFGWDVASLLVRKGSERIIVYVDLYENGLIEKTAENLINYENASNVALHTRNKTTEELAREVLSDYVESFPQ